MICPAISRWLATWPAAMSEPEALQRIDGARRWAAAGEAVPLALLDTAQNRLLGWISVNRDRSRPGRGILGYWLGEQHHGRGYMREALPAALDAAFTTLDLDVVTAAIQTTNLASLAVAQACGMARTGEALVDTPSRGQYERCFIYEIMRPLPPAHR